MDRRTKVVDTPIYQGAVVYRVAGSDNSSFAFDIYTEIVNLKQEIEDNSSASLDLDIDDPVEKIISHFGISFPDNVHQET